MVLDWVKWEQNRVLVNSKCILPLKSEEAHVCMGEKSTGGHTSPLGCTLSRSGSCAGNFLPFFYLVVALRVKAVVMFSILVCTVYVSTVLTARKPANMRGGQKKKRERE